MLVQHIIIPQCAQRELPQGALTLRMTERLLLELRTQKKKKKKSFIVKVPISLSERNDSEGEISKMNELKKGVDIGLGKTDWIKAGRGMKARL